MDDNSGRVNMTKALSYGGHVNSCQELRRLKAEKVRRILAGRRRLAEAAVLDLGAGSGLLSGYLQPYCRSIVAADRDISTFDVPGVAVNRIEGVMLPFETGNFDVVIYNHVIEHVGDRSVQHCALEEIWRVLAPGGHLYLAVPNRWTLIEPHYRLPFLSWLPQYVADILVRRFRGGRWYDCNPLGRGELMRLMRGAGFEVEDASLEAIGHVVDLELQPGWKRRLIERMPDPLLRRARPMLPSFVMIGRKGQ
jgi:SAM-dependent methyltransferase